MSMYGKNHYNIVKLLPPTNKNKWEKKEVVVPKKKIVVVVVVHIHKGILLSHKKGIKLGHL